MRAAFDQKFDALSIQLDDEKGNKLSTDTELIDDFQKLHNLFTDSPESIYRILIADRMQSHTPDTRTPKPMPVVLGWHGTMGAVGAWRALPVSAEIDESDGAIRVVSAARKDNSFDFLLRAAPTKTGAILAIAKFIARDMHRININAMNTYPARNFHDNGRLFLAVPESSHDIMNLQDEAVNHHQRRRALQSGAS